MDTMALNLSSQCMGVPSHENVISADETNFSPEAPSREEGLVLSGGKARTQLEDCFYGPVRRGRLKCLRAGAGMAYVAVACCATRTTMLSSSQKLVIFITDFLRAGT